MYVGIPCNQEASVPFQKQNFLVPSSKHVWMQFISGSIHINWMFYIF